VITIENIDYGTSEVNLRYSNFRIIRDSDVEVSWVDRDSGETLAVMEEKKGVLNFKRLWNSR
tara:strand:+ start:385 stop:570 length:186 start_codon:yes stop_codon:yes gene_type:complete